MPSAVESAIAIFAVTNMVRVLAYVPQILRVARDRDGAAAVSCLTWLMFAVSHLSTVAYALIVVDDWRMAAIFAVNLMCCLLIIGLTCYKRALAGSGWLVPARRALLRNRARFAPLRRRPARSPPPAAGSTRPERAEATGGCRPDADRGG